MKYSFLNKENKGRLIIIFAGWSTGPDFYRHIHINGWDLLVIYAYTDFDFPLHIIENYHTVVVFAWSLGVFMAEAILPAEKIALAVAINGTPYPVDDRYGIPERIFHATAYSLSTANLVKFRRRMCEKTYESLSELFMESENDIDDLKEQLKFISRKSVNPEESPDSSPVASFRWHRVYISNRDLIFPTDSQRRAWETHPSNPEIILIDGPHYIDLQRIISSAIPEKDKVGKRFHRALPTYDRQATAQRAIARRLSEFPGGVPFSPKKVIEIGPGTGIFTKFFSDRFHPQSIEYIDLYPLPEFGLAPEEAYFMSDAEEWMSAKAKESAESTKETRQYYDAIISASALQWFANPEAFFRNAASILRPGGFLLCSTFVPGNLEEMKTVNPFSIIYRRVEELEEIIKKYFLFVKLEEERLVIDFKSPLETLRHLKDTGVSGGLEAGLSPRNLLDSIPLRLSYRPLYIYAVKASRRASPLSPPLSDFSS